MALSLAPVRVPRRAAPTAIWRGALGVALLVAILEIVSRRGIVDSAFLPPFSDVLLATGRAFGDPVFLADVASTVTTFVLALAIAIVIAVPLGVLLGLSEPSYRASRAVIELIRPVPPVALIPLVLLVFGNGLEMKLVVVVFASVWAILFNTIYGVHDVDHKAVEMGRSFGLTRLAIIRRIMIPSAAPFVMTGIRVSAAIALIVAITVEILAGGATGIGAFIARQRATGADVALVYAGILVSGALGLVVNIVLGALERRVFAWDRGGKDV